MKRGRYAISYIIYVGGNMQWLACHLSLAQRVNFFEQDCSGTGEVAS